MNISRDTDEIWTRGDIIIINYIGQSCIHMQGAPGMYILVYNYGYICIYAYSIA